MSLLRRVLRAVSLLAGLFFGFGGSVSAQCPSPPTNSIENLDQVAQPSSSGWTVTWAAPAGAIDGTTVYEVLTETGTGYCHFGQSAVAARTTSRTYTMQVSPNTTFGIYIRLQSDPCVTSTYTLVNDMFTSLAAKPPAPTVAVAGSDVTVTAGAYTDDRTFGLDVYRVDAGGLSRFVGFVGSTCGSTWAVTDTSVPAGTYGYLLRAWNWAGSSDSDPVTVTIGPVVRPVITSFAATPPTIRAGQSAVLSFATQSATAVTLDNGLGAQPLSGSVTVTPSATTTYTLTAMNGGQTATAQVTVTVITQAAVAVSAFPSAMVQNAGSSGGTTGYVLTNAGGAGTTVTLTQSGTFFTQAPATFSLAAGASQTVTITAKAQSAGAYEGASIVAGSGVPAGLQIPVKLLSAAPATGTVGAKPQNARVDLAGAAGSTSSGKVSFTNPGTGTVTGVLVSDSPWIIPQAGVVTIPPGGTSAFDLTIDRSRRPDAAAAIGSLTGTLSIVYAAGSTSAMSLGASEATQPAVSVVSVVDTVKPAVGSSGAPALGAGEVALFVPGVGHVAGGFGSLFISDLSIVNPPGNRPVPDLKFYYLPLGGSSGAPKSAALPTISVASVAVADVVKNVFGVDGQVGSLQLRAADAAKLAVNATIFNVSNPAGTYGSSIPTFRSDRSVTSGGKLVLSGLRKAAGTHTNVFIQETSGKTVAVNTLFLAADGSTVGTRGDTVGPFVLSQLNNVVPAGAVAAIMTNASAADGGAFQAYATPVDEISGDTWTVADWGSAYGYDPTAVTVVPVAGLLRGANNTFFRTDVALTNGGTTQASGTLRYVSRSGTAIDRQVTLGQRQSNIISDVLGSLFGVTTTDAGYLLFTPATGSIAMTSRTYTTVAGEPKTFGTGVPAQAVASALTAGMLRSIGSLEDASTATITAARPGTFRTNYGLVETSGNRATVRVTVRYQFSAGQLTTAIGAASKEYDLAANQFLQVNGLMADILGAQRAALGDLRGITVDFQVTGGTGAVTVFTSSVDNGSGDSTLRTD